MTFLVYLMYLYVFFPETIRLMMSLQVDRIKQRQVRWGQSYTNPNSENYRTLEDEAIYAVSSFLLYFLLLLQFLLVLKESLLMKSLHFSSD